MKSLEEEGGIDRRQFVRDMTAGRSFVISVYLVFYVLFCLLMRGVRTKNVEMIKVERDKIVPRRK